MSKISKLLELMDEGQLIRGRANAPTPCTATNHRPWCCHKPPRSSERSQGCSSRTDSAAVDTLENGWKWLKTVGNGWKLWATFSKRLKQNGEATLEMFENGQKRSAVVRWCGQKRLEIHEMMRKNTDKHECRALRKALQKWRIMGRRTQSIKATY